MKKKLFLLLMLSLPLITFAQDLEGQTEKIVELILNFAKILTGGIMIVMIVAHAIKYMTTKDDERGEGASQKLKSGILKIIIGGAIVFSATMIAEYIIDGIK